MTLFSPDQESKANQIIDGARSSPKGIRDMNETRVHYLLKAKGTRDKRKSEIFKPNLTSVKGFDSLRSPKESCSTSMERRQMYEPLFKGSHSTRNIDDERTMTAPKIANWTRKQAIAKALNLSSKNGPNHTNQFDF